jgi:hypothetical protein
MVGTHLLLLIQAALVLWSAPHLGAVLRVLVALVLIIAASGLGAVIHGVSEDNRQDRRRRRHGR